MKSDGLKYLMRAFCLFSLTSLFFSLIIANSIDEVSLFWLPLLLSYVILGIPWGIAGLVYYKFYRDKETVSNWVRLLFLICIPILIVWTLIGLFAIAYATASPLYF